MSGFFFRNLFIDMMENGLFSNKAEMPPSYPKKDFEVIQPPEDSVSALAFSPAALLRNYLIAGSWDNSVRCWEVEENHKTVPKALQSMTMPILSACWSDDGTKVFMASCDKQVKCWDLESNQTMQVAAHDAPVSTCHWIKAPSYTCLLTGSWDKSLKFWDTRSSNPMLTINLTERVYCVDADYPLAVIGTASKGISVYKLEGKPEFVRNINSPLKYQHRCISIFRNKKKSPVGFGLGSVEGRTAICHVNPQSSSFNFTFKCHRINNTGAVNVQDIYAVNDIKFHPVTSVLATVGSDGTYSFWDKDARTKVQTSEKLDQPITKCCFSSNGKIFAYSLGYDWSKGHEYNTPDKKPQIFLKAMP